MYVNSFLPTPWYSWLCHVLTHMFRIEDEADRVRAVLALAPDAAAKDMGWDGEDSAAREGGVTPASLERASDLQHGYVKTKPAARDWSMGLIDNGSRRIHVRSDVGRSRVGVGN